MKTNLTTTLLLLCCFAVSYGQDEETLEKLAKRNQINTVAKASTNLKDNFYSSYKNDLDVLKEKDSNSVYNNVVLNLYFKNVISSYATNTGDLSFNKYIVDANTSSKTLTIGASFNLSNFFEFCNRENVKAIRPVQKLTHLLTLSVKSDLSDGFSKFYSKNSDTEEYNFNSNIGIGAKYTHVNRGKIRATSNKQLIEKVRKDLVKSHIEKSIKTYIEGDFEKEVELLKIKYNDVAKLKEETEKLIQKKYLEFYKAISEKELEFAAKEHLIKSTRVIWWSVDGFLPVKGKEVFVSEDAVSKIDTLTFNNWSASLTGNYLRSFYSSIVKDASIKFTGAFSVFNTNNFIAGNTSAKTFQPILQDNGSQLVFGPTQSVFLGDYKRFTASSFKGEVSTLFFNNSIGLSAGFEYVFGDTDIENTNWKLGIPFSLKDKDDKPTLNFEVQWKELNNSHFAGISVGYNFGKFVK